MTLVVPSLSLMCIFLPAKPACLGISRGAVAMLHEFLRHGKKDGQTSLIPISGRVPVLSLEFAHGRSGFQPTVEYLPWTRWIFGEFLQWFFGCKMHK